jgi:origin recognition complex subunit 2
MPPAPQVIVVSGKIPKPKITRARKPKATSGSKKRRRSTKIDSTRSDASLPASDREDEESEHEANEVVNDADEGPVESMEEDSLSSRSRSDEESEGGIEQATETPAKGPRPKRTKVPKTGGPPPMETFINQTAFDVYFAYASSRLRISSNVLSSLIEPLTREETQSLEQKVLARAEQDINITRLCKSHEDYFENYWLELQNGFNLLFYGYGSKKETLTQFAKAYCATEGHVIVINGYKKRTNLKAIITAIEQVPGLVDKEVLANGWEGQLLRIYDFFRDTDIAPLYLVIHNIESQSLRDTKTRTFLSTLALHPRIHIITSVDNINAGFLWSSTEITARKHPFTGSGQPVPSTRGYAWLFHDLTTFKPYIHEMRSRDVTALPSQNQGTPAGTASGQVLTEQAMLHILASVTEKAKRLFSLLATRQMASIDEEPGKQPTGVTGLEKYGMQYDLLFNEARKDFLATSDVALRALLGEFMDHEMIKAGGQPEVLWIPASKEILKRVLHNLT